MSKAINSPTGRLLRNSRLFSLPPPLPAAPVDRSTAGQILRTSDTATQPYPTRQAISSPVSSRSRGDWGLKRPLPDRAIPKNAPHLRIKAIDTLEHITDFESAADHTQSLAKWQHMNIPLSLAPNAARSQIVGSMYRAPRPSAFSDAYDNTTLINHGSDQTTFTAERAMRARIRDAESAHSSAEDSPPVTRWKTQGPHLPGLTEEEFDRYLMNLVRQHKSEFRKFLEAVKTEEKRKVEQASMRDTADEETFELELQHRSRLDKYELDDWIKELRDNHESLNSELSKLVREFFDLPAFPTPRQARSANTFGTHSYLADEIARPKNDAGPPSTHPSAGLSYLLTNAVVNNHPEYGPLADREPVQARVLRTKNGNYRRDNRADVGLGGFVTSINPGISPGTSSSFKPISSRSGALEQNPLGFLDLSLTGGNKVWLQPRSAYVDETGRIRLDVGEASRTSVAIKLGDDVPPEASPFPVKSRGFDQLDSGFNRAKFGTGFTSEQSLSSRAIPFDHANNASHNKSGVDLIKKLAGWGKGSE